MKFDEFCFHDSIIKNIDYDGKLLSISISESHYENSFSNLQLEIPIKADDFSIYLIRRYPKRHNVHIKGREITFSKLKSLFKKGKFLIIVDVLKEIDVDSIVFKTDIFPYSKARGVQDMLIINLEECRNIIFKDLLK